MKREMRMNLILMVLGSLLALAVVSCQSTDNTDTSGYSFQSSRSSGGPGADRGPSEGGGAGGNMQQLPQLAESTELLLKIENLAGNADPLLALTKDQSAKIIPVLSDWKETLEAGRKAGTEEFVNELNSQLSVAQAEYQLQMGPPGSGGENGMPQGPPPSSDSSSDRPMGPPSDVELLTNILDKLS